MMEVTLGIQENIAKNLVFVDGISSVGKSLFYGIIPSLEKMEHIQFYYLLEKILPALSLKIIDESFAKSLIRTEMNEFAYNIKLSRNMNFRLDDGSGVFNYKDPKLYFTRLFRKTDDRKGVVTELRQTDWYIPIMSHDLLVNLESLERLDLDYHLIELFRHPVDIIYTWWNEGLGERFCNDPQIFALSVAYGNNTMPWYCAGIEDEWLRLNPVERCVRLVLSLTKKSIEQYNNALNKERILIISFEDFVENPDKNVKRICSFLNTSITEYTQQSIYQARCPRKIDIRERIERLNSIKDIINDSLFGELMELSERYENNCYSLPIW